VGEGTSHPQTSNRAIAADVDGAGLYSGRSGGTLSAMEQPILVAVDVPLVGDERRKNWAKVVTGVDDTLATGWAYEGEFIATGGIQDVPVGSIILSYGERGSRANPQIEATVLLVNSDATVSQVATAKGRAWARTLRDQVVELIADADGAPIARKDWDPTLIQFSDEAISEEVRRRGL
jgi:hypothetical protein